MSMLWWLIAIAAVGVVIYYVLSSGSEVTTTGERRGMVTGRHDEEFSVDLDPGDTLMVDDEENLVNDTGVTADDEREELRSENRIGEDIDEKAPTSPLAPVPTSLSMGLDRDDDDLKEHRKVKNFERAKKRLHHRKKK